MITSKDKTLIIGASAGLGEELFRRRFDNSNGTVVGTYNKFKVDIDSVYYLKGEENKIHLDISKDGWEKKIDWKSFDEVIITAAMTDVTACDKYPKESYQVNVQPIDTLVKHLRDIKHRPHILFCSTDFVYDTKSGPPVNEYGKQKLIAEQILFRSDANFKIHRFSCLFGGFRQNSFPIKIIKQLFDNNEIEVPTMMGYPTHVYDAANNINLSSVANREGINHITVKKSRAEWAEDIIKIVGANVKVKHVSPFDNRPKDTFPYGVMTKMSMDKIESHYKAIYKREKRIKDERRSFGWRTWYQT